VSTLPRKELGSRPHSQCIFLSEATVEFRRFPTHTPTGRPSPAILVTVYTPIEIFVPYCVTSAWDVSA
jgi:hypothetical protein